ncbi:MAG TPA: hypothetical protein VKE41_12180 [Roseiflexaceae bacterium]|nr:hypothetical protein [Roseiflexaceae bacterium]
MDPITAINLEFVREVREEWSREPAALTKQTMRAARPSRADHLRVAVGQRLIAARMWLQAHAAPANL